MDRVLVLEVIDELVRDAVPVFDAGVGYLPMRGNAAEEIAAGRFSWPREPGQCGSDGLVVVSGVGKFVIEMWSAADGAVIQLPGRVPDDFRAWVLAEYQRNSGFAFSAPDWVLLEAAEMVVVRDTTTIYRGAPASWNADWYGPPPAFIRDPRDQGPFQGSAPGLWIYDCYDHTEREIEVALYLWPLKKIAAASGKVMAFQSAETLAKWALCVKNRAIWEHTFVGGLTEGAQREWAQRKIQELHDYARRFPGVSKQAKERAEFWGELLA